MIRLFNRTFIYFFTALVAGFLISHGLLQFLDAIELPDLGLLGNNLLYGAILEEALKFLVVYALYSWSRQPAVALLVGLSYGVSERMLYWFASGTLVLHDALALCMHAVAGFASMYFLKKHKVTTQRRDLLFALLAQMVVHGVYNLLIWLWYMMALQGL